MPDLNLTGIQELLATAKESGIKVSYENNKLLLRTQKGKIVDAAFLDTLKHNRDHLVTFFQSQPAGEQRTALTDHIQPTRRSPEAQIPLSFNQERLWFIDQREGSVQYHEPAILRLKGTLEIPALAFALRNIVNRHEVLRTVIIQENGIPYQQVLAENGWELEIIDEPLLKENEIALQQRINELTNAPFDLAQHHMLRASLIVLPAEEHLLVVTMHHIASDGWSKGIIIQEVRACYQAYISGQEVALPPLPIQYADYAIWQRAYITGKLLEDQLAYWKQKLSGVSPLHLPTDHTRPAIQSTKGAVTTFSVDPALALALNRLSRQHKVTLFIIMLATFKVLLYRYSGQIDICVGTPVAGRRKKEIKGLIGFFINTLALRSDLSENPTFLTLLQQVKQTTREALDHQDAPIEKIVEQVLDKRDPGRSPLFQVIFGYQPSPATAEGPLGAAVLYEEKHRSAASKLDLVFTMEDHASGLTGTVMYCTDLYNEDTIQRMIAHFQQLLHAVVQTPEARISALPLLTPSEAEQLQQGFNRHTVAYPPAADSSTVVELFEAAAARTPDATALLFEEERLTYRELDERANQLAHYLKGKGVKAGALVPLCIERSLDMIVGIMGILKAGAAYVPVEPDYPPERISYMLKDTGAAVIVSSNASADQLPDTDDMAVVKLDDDYLILSMFPVTPLPAVEGNGHLVYVIYTSGSTGAPKGVMVTHRNLADYVHGLKATLPLPACHSYGLLSSIATDLGNTVIYAALTTGAALYLFSKTAVHDAEKLTAYFAEHPVDCIKIVPSHWKALSAPGKPLLPQKLLIFGGETLEAAVVEQIGQTAPDCMVVNHYGPTETTIGKLLHIVNAGFAYNGVVPIGKPFSNTVIYVMDAGGTLCPVGVPGELYIGGEGVAAGYLHQTGLTAAQFIPDPFTAGTGNRLYRTGDLVKYLPDGNVVFLGRADEQVKIRGYRVEPGEIELVLNRAQGVNQGIVTVRTDHQGNKRLAAYVVAHEAFEASAVLTYLRQQLPEYMVPSSLTVLEQLPLMANGKADRKALPDPDVTAPAAHPYTAPRNEAEQTLAGIWEAVLGVERVGVHDNFFDLGGDSILSIQVVSRARRSGYALQVADLFDHQTIADLCEKLLSAKNGELLASPAVPVFTPAGDELGAVVGQPALDRFLDEVLSTGGTRREHITAVYRLSGLQEGMLFHALYEGSGGAYTNQFTYRLQSPDVEVLQQSWQHLLARHTILRSSFYADVFPVPVQCVHREARLPVHQLDHRHLDTAAQEQAWTSFEAADRAQGFDLTQPPLMRLTLIQLSATQYRMVWTFHHLLVDGWSLPVLMEELLQTYELLSNGQPVPVTEEDRYEDYIRYLEARDKEAATAYWRAYLAGIEQPTLLPFITTTSERNKGKGYHAAELLTLDAAKTSRIQAFAQQNRLTVNTVMQGVWAYLLYRYTGKTHVTYGVTVSGRPDDLPGIEQRVGLYINTLPLHAAIDKNAGIVAWLRQLQQEQVQSRRYQYTPLNDSCRLAGITGDLFDTLLVFENYPLNKITLSDTWRLQATDLQIAEHTNYPLSVSIDVGDITRLVFIHNTTLLPATYVRQLGAHFVHVLEQLLAFPAAYLKDIHLLSSAERQQLEAYNQTTAPYPKDLTIMELFEAQVKLRPDNTAIIYEGTQLTYGELDNRSNQVAQLLLSKGVQSGYYIGLLSYRGAEMIISILGILKSGCAYVPMHTGYPPERLAMITADAGIPYILYTDEGLFATSGLPAQAGIPVTAAAACSCDPVPLKAQPHDGAYVMYTSGTTGRPKGIAVSHQQIIKLVFDPGPIAIIPDDTVLQWSNYAFDGATYDIYGALLRGARLCMIPDPAASDVFELAKIITDNQVTVCFMTTALFNNFVDSAPAGLQPLRKLLFGGEAVSHVHVAKALDVLDGGKLLHMYGPTETTVYATCYPVDVITDAIIPIGKPLANTSVLILDEQGEAAPAGVHGELYIGGDGVSLGYINNAPLTAEKFLSLKGSAGRWYRTGDIGYRLPDGNIVYAGRKDQQVKIRGYRVELGEIEQVLQQNAGVSQAVVLARADANGHKRLTGYVLPAGTFDREALQNYLREQLPDYMVPAHLVEMDQWPLNANGKIDRQALPDPDVLPNGDTYAAPRNTAEQALAGIWQTLLGIQQVGIYDNFFELGGDSILSIQVVSRAKRLGYQLQPRDLFLHPTIAGLSAVGSWQGTSGEPVALNGRSGWEGLASQAELDRFLDEAMPTGGTRREHIMAVYRLSGLQEGMLFHGLYDNAAGAYTEQFSCYLESPDVEVFLRSWQHLLTRHSILRSSFYADVFSVPVQCVHRQVQLPVQRLDYRGMDATQQEQAWIAFATTDRAQGFDFTQPPLMRLALIQLSNTRYRMVWTFHHLLLDGWSMPVLMEELLQTYETLSNGQSLIAGEEDRYEDYIRYLEVREKETELAYWQQYLSGIDRPTLLPFIPTGAGAEKSKGDHRTSRLILDADKSGRIQAFAQQNHLTVNTVMQGVWAYLLYRYTGNTHITYGVTVSGRPDDLPGVEQRVGLYINTLPLHTEIKETCDIKEWLQQLQQEQAQSRRYQHTPLNESQRAAGITGALFDTLLVFENYPVNEMVLSDTWRLRVSDPHMEEFTNYPLSITISTGPEIKIAFKYNATILEGFYVTQMVRHFEQVIDQLLSSFKLEDISLLTTTDDRLLEAFNNTEVAYPDSTLIEQFATQVQLWPDRTAITFENTKLSYHELDVRSWQLAHYLRSRGVVNGSLVVVCMDRCTDIVVAMLGILKAGGAYVPVDPGYPVQRIGYMLSDSGAGVVVCNRASKAKVEAGEEWEVIVLDEGLISSGNIIIKSTEDEARSFVTGITSAALSYVIYTSGSTGTPKGVMISHRGVMNLVHWHIHTYKVTADSKATALAGVSFDAFGWELWPYLLSGASVHLLSDATRGDVTTLVQELVAHGITHSFLPTGLAGAFIETSRLKSLPLQYLLTGGDHLPPTDITGLSYQVVNNYGPTENSVVSTYYPLSAKDHNNTPPIGWPVSNTTIYITDEQLRLLPVGVIGEICISGAGLALGYLHREALTAAQFVANPFKPGARLYRSGDLGRWLPDGSIEYLGRKDEQVKIRGYRIELGEITQVLQQCPLVRQAVVLARATEQGHKRLTGYILPSGVFDREGILAYLQEQLPDHMIPAQLLAVDQWPLTPNGKIDRSALPDPDVSTLAADHYVPPQNESQRQLVEIWQDLLGVGQIGVHDNFFALGGDSILSIQVVSRAKRLGYLLQPRDLFQHSTIAGLSGLLSEQGAVPAAEQGLLSGSSGLLPVQQWFFETEAGGGSHFNHSVLLAIDKDVDTAVLSAAITQLALHHDSLRFIYQHGGQVYGSSEGTLIVEDLQAVAAGDLATIITARGGVHQGSLDLSKGLLFKAVLFLTPQAITQHRLLLIIHHLAVDGVSWRILLDDLAVLLDETPQQIPLALGRKSSSYRDWYAALVRYGQRARLLEQQTHWVGIIQQHKPLLTDHVYEAPLRIQDMGSYQVRLATPLTRRLLQETSRAYRTEINDLLLSALTQTLCNWVGGPVVIGLEGHGREDIDKHTDISRTVGWFTSLYPVLLNGGTSQEPGVLIKTVKEQLRQIPDKGIGYGVLKYLNKATALQGNDPWEITFNYLGQFDALFRQQGRFKPVDEYAGDTIGADYTIRRKLAINSMVTGGELVVDWSYSIHHFNESTITALAENYMQALQTLIAHTTSRSDKPVLTPSDYGLGGVVSHQSLDRFMDEVMLTGSIRRDQIASIYRLSGLQEGMLFHGLYDNAAGAYTEQFSCYLESPDVEVFLQSWQHLLTRHSILRSSFYADVFSVPVQCVHRQVQLPVQQLDYRGMDATQQEQAWIAFETADRAQGFDFTQPPLMRLALIQLSSTQYRMVWTFHHLLIDGWSMPVLMEELLQTYERLSSGQALTNVEEDRYEDYIRYLERRDKEAAAAYWRQYLSRIDRPTQLPFITPTPERTMGKGLQQSEHLTLHADKTGRILAFAQQNGLTVNTVMQGVWASLLYRYTGNAHITYGVTVSGRPDDLPGVEQRVGLYINTLPLHTEIKETRDIKEWLQQLQQEQAQSRRYQHTPLNESQRAAGIADALFDTLLVFENYPVNEMVLSDTWRLRVSDPHMEEFTNYPLSITISTGQEIKIAFKYNATLLEGFYATQMVRHFEQVIDQLLSSFKLEDISLLTTTDDQLLAAFNNTEVAYPDNTLVEQFATQVQLWPDRTAITFENTKLSYHELDVRSWQLAFYLRSRGVVNGSLVAVCMDRCADIVVAMLGILKAGGAYVPVDPGYPVQRIGYMLSDSGAGVIICNRVSKAKVVEAGGDLEVIVSGENIADPARPFTTGLTSTALAYVIYTSGSTGMPKGVMISHRGVMNLVHWHIHTYKVTADSKATVLAGVGFDAFGWELWPYLLSGAEVRLLSDATRGDVTALVQELADHGITHSFLPTGLAGAFIETSRFKSLPLQYLLTGGDHLPPTDITGLGYHVVNNYGPTENSVVSTYYPLSTKDHNSTPPIGWPVSNTTIYITDEQLRLLPVGVIGEICISGAGLALGYLHREALTAAQFVANPFNPGARLYRSGDLGRWLPDGSIEYLGRRDEQVKIRGYRVELGEITQVLQQCPLVRQAVVLARTGEQGHKRLIAYILPSGVFDREGILAYLQEQLPNHMIPAQLVAVDQWPLTPNGKIDRSALPDPEISTLAADHYVSPQNEPQRQLVKIWQDLLGIGQIGIHDNLFALGADSLLSIRAKAAIRQALGVEVLIRHLYDHPTIASLSLLLEQRLPEGVGTLADKQILRLNDGAATRPVFLLPGQHGISEGYDELALALAAAGLIYGLQLPGVYEDEKPLDSIPAIAAQYIRWMQQRQPVGPYRLIAHSFGSYVAFEVAQQLAKAQEKVEYLVIMDAAAHPAPLMPEDEAEKARFLLETAVAVMTRYHLNTHLPEGWLTVLSAKTAGLTAMEVLPGVTNFINEQWEGAGKEHLAFVMRLLQLTVHNIKVLDSYTIKGTIPAELVVVKAAGSHWEHQDAYLGWQAHAAQVKTVTIPGDHFSMLRREPAEVLWQQLRQLLHL